MQWLVLVFFLMGVQAGAVSGYDLRSCQDTVKALQKKDISGLKTNCQQIGDGYADCVYALKGPGWTSVDIEKRHQGCFGINLTQAKCMKDYLGSIFNNSSKLKAISGLLAKDQRYSDCQVASKEYSNCRRTLFANDKEEHAICMKNPKKVLKDKNFASCIQAKGAGGAEFCSNANEGYTECLSEMRFHKSGDDLHNFCQKAKAGFASCTKQFSWLTVENAKSCMGGDEYMLCRCSQKSGSDFTYTECMEKLKMAKQDPGVKKRQVYGYNLGNFLEDFSISNPGEEKSCQNLSDGFHDCMQTSLTATLFSSSSKKIASCHRAPKWYSECMKQMPVSGLDFELSQKKHEVCMGKDRSKALALARQYRAEARQAAGLQ